MKTQYLFKRDERKAAVRIAKGVDGKPVLNGIDYLEVSSDQKELAVHFIHNFPENENGVSTSEVLTKENVIIQGGVRIRDVRIETARSSGNILTLGVNKPGDFSIYTLRLVPTESNPIAGYDPELSELEFSFKINCPNEFDCRSPGICPPERKQQPEINYLAKDFTSFRQMMLNRMAVLMPEWKERNQADAGVALVELLAHAGDYLSYQQDAIATEAYMDTARSRISIRRHARLVDYFMHNGCNARVWVQVQVRDDMNLPKGTKLLTYIDDQPKRIPAYDQSFAKQAEVFETMYDSNLFQLHNEFFFYTWGASECCLPKGAIRATLKGKFPNLKAGDVLVFLEVKSHKTDRPDDADPSHRHAVRLNHVKLFQDPLGEKVLEKRKNEPVDVTEIQWHSDDALPFPLCISSIIIDENKRKYINNVSIAIGNIILADHGSTIGESEYLGKVPEPELFRVQPASGDGYNEPAIKPVPSRFRPHLNEKPLTFAVPYHEKRVFSIDYKAEYRNELDKKNIPLELQQRFKAKGIDFEKNVLSVQGSKNEWSISDYEKSYLIRKENVPDENGEFKGDRELNVYELPESAKKNMDAAAKDALPVITLESKFLKETYQWDPKRDLLSSGMDTKEFVVEMEEDETASLRFGDDQQGLRPTPGTTFTAIYRTGNGTRGNVGSGTIEHIVSKDPAIEGVFNPLPAQGGVEPESIENVRQRAPNALRTQERAVTPQDYALVAERHPEVQKAAASLRWTGSWWTVFVAIDRKHGLPVDDEFKKEMQEHLGKFRMAGHDIKVDNPRFVSLEIEMIVHVMSDHFKSDVKEDLIQVLSNRDLPDGRRGIFHPDNLTFGQTVYLSPLYKAALAVDGVASVQITRFQRLDYPGNEALDTGKFILGWLEIPRLDNDPNFPENGVIRFIMEGGK